MEIDYIMIITLVTYVLGAITKCFVNAVPTKFIPLQNVVIGVLAGLICYFTNIEPNLLQAIALCLIASTSAGGIADLKKVREE